MFDDDIIDSRDLENRRDELQDEYNEYLAEREAFKNDAIDSGKEFVEEDYPEFDDLDELNRLIKICEEGESTFSEWKYGTILINDSYFEEYAREYAQDIGAIERDTSWPCTYIDWEAAANALKMDYCSMDIDGETYYGN